MSGNLDLDKKLTERASEEEDLLGNASGRAQEVAFERKQSGVGKTPQNVDKKLESSTPEESIGAEHIVERQEEIVPEVASQDTVEFKYGESDERFRRDSKLDPRHVRLSLIDETIHFSSDDFLNDQIRSRVEDDLDDFALLPQQNTETAEEELEEVDLFEEQKDRDDVSAKSASIKLKPTTSVQISYDFVLEDRPTQVMSHITFTPSEVHSLHMTSIGELVAEDEKSEVVEQEVALDRNMYYELYFVFKSKHDKEKIKSNYLQAKLANYYMHRKMFHVLRESGAVVSEIKEKYNKQIEELEEVMEGSERNKQSILDETARLQEQQQRKHLELITFFDKLHQTELDYSKTLTFDHTGRTNMDKLAERYLRRQKNQTALLSKLRLAHIRLKNLTAETTAALEALDNLGPGYRIMDYNSLKIDNRNLRDKLEEKDTELVQLRNRCKNNMQVLAHYREKVTALDSDTANRKEDLEAVELDHADAREQLHYLQQERKKVRHDIKNLKQQYGLLTYPKMLRDMEKSVQEIDALKFNIEYLQADYLDRSQKIVAVRRNREYFLLRRQKDEEMKQRVLKAQASDSWFNLNVNG